MFNRKLFRDPDPNKKEFKLFYSASVMAVKKVIPSDSNSPSKIENPKSSSISAQNSFFPNILSNYGL